MTRRWKIGDYELKFNPKRNRESMSPTNRPNQTANGRVTAHNFFYDNSINLSFDIYDKPTRFNTAPFATGINVRSIAEKDFTEDILCLVGNSIQFRRSRDGSLVKTISLPSGAVSISYVGSDEIAVWYGSSELVIIDENGSQKGKYIYNDTDMGDIVSITSDYDSNIYGLNKYGKVFLIEKVNNGRSLMFTASDFNTNKENDVHRYREIEYIDNYFAIVIDNEMSFFDMGLNRVYSTYIGRDISGVSYGRYSKKFCSIIKNNLHILQPNYCGVEIDKVKKQLSRGMVEATDEKGMTINIVLSSVNITRKRNMDDSRYEVAIQGDIV